jgi:DNA-binding PadR family transcriptional regulator
MTATLGDILLVFLADDPGTAHDLQQRHAQTFGPERAVDVLRVVNALARLERLGLIRTSPRKSLPRARSYTVSEAGRRRQQSWILEMPPAAGGQDVIERILLAMAATDRATFDAVVASCLSVLESQRLPAEAREQEPVMSVRRVRAEFEDAMTASALTWVRQLAGRPRERDTTGERVPVRADGAHYIRRRT